MSVEREGARKLTHLDEHGRASMVDVGAKPITQRRAVASGRIVMRVETLRQVREGSLQKGDVLTVARIAGIQAAKRTAELVPLCHPLPLNHVEVEFELEDDAPAGSGEGTASIVVRASAATSARTGVEMEALTATTVALLTIYDMAKAADRAMRLQDIHVMEKRGGASGTWRHTP